MKVIKDGIKRNIELRCRKCLCEFEVDLLRDSLYHNLKLDKDGNIKTSKNRYVNCPSCDKKIWIK